MHTQNTLWYYLAIAPTLIALLGAAVLTVLALTGIPQDGKLLLVMAFAFADLTTILAGSGGIVYLLNPHRTPQALRWVWINVALFFIAAFSGVALFIQL